VIAETLARYYVLQTGASGMVCHVFYGQQEYTKGSFYR
jgi:hypothetical protein